jgi:hypothetical protein
MQNKNIAAYFPHFQDNIITLVAWAVELMKNQHVGVAFEHTH